jgi:hypothetical protein
LRSSACKDGFSQSDWIKVSERVQKRRETPMDWARLWSSLCNLINLNRTAAAAERVAPLCLRLAAGDVVQ